jgi:hypothetical protein
MTKKEKARLRRIEEIAHDRDAALAVVGLAVRHGYLDELFENQQARDAFADDVMGVHIRRVVDEAGGVILDDGSIYRGGVRHPPTQVVPELRRVERHDEQRP